MAINVVTATFKDLQRATTPPINYQYDTVQKLKIEGLELPEYYGVDFCNDGDPDTMTLVGTAAGVAIPDEYLLDGRDIKAYIVITEGDSVQTRYEITIPVIRRPGRTDMEPTPAEQQQIDSLIEALNDAVEDAEDAADGIRNMTVEAENLPAGSPAEAEWDGDTNTLTFGIPAGNSGVYIGEEEPEDPDVSVWIAPGGNDYVKATTDEINAIIDSAFYRKKSIISDINSQETVTVSTVSSVRVVKSYGLFPATEQDSFIISMKTKSLHPSDFAYNVRARKYTADGQTGIYYYLLPTPQTVASEAVIEGVLSGFGADTVGLEFQLVYNYVGSGSSPYSETFDIEHFSVGTFDYILSTMWERGYYSTSGKATGSSSSAIRTKATEFIQACKGSTINNLSSNARLRYCVYTQPFEGYFVARYDVNAGGHATISDNCYIRVYMEYRDGTEFDLDTWIANLPPMWGGEIIQLNPMVIYSPADPALSDSSENGIQNKVATQTFNIMMPSFVLPSNWESKVQTIQEAQGTKFSFAIQTDTHYALDDDIYNGANLKALTNRIGFDFVANLGDVIEGYAVDEDTPENMKAAMTEIMMRYVRGISCPLLIAMGNHDTNKQWADAHSGTPFTFDEVWGREFRPSFNTIPGVVYQTGLMYYYKDFNDVRVIVLNTQDGTDGGFGIGSTQISWLTNTALNTNKPVLVMSHVPIVDGWSVSSNYVSSYADAVTAIKAFQTGGGTVIGCMSGHTHTQETQTIDGILYVTFRNSASLCEVVMVDIANKAINTIPVGFTGAGNRSFSYL